MSVRPRDALFHGTVEASAFLIDPAICGEREARRRIVELWEPGLRVSRVDGAYLVRLPKPRFVAARQAAGLPLVSRGGALVAFESGERFAHGIVRMHHGVVVNATSDESVDPASWLEVAMPGVAPESLGSPPAPPEHQVKRETRDVRVLIPGAPPLAPGAFAAVRALMKAQERSETGSAGVTPAQLSKGCLAIARIGAWAAFIIVILRAKSEAEVVFWIITTILVAILFRLLSSGATAAAEAVAGRAPGRSAARRTRRPSLDRFRQWLTRLASATRLTSLIGRAHAKYLAKMLAMFEEGNFEEALRHAIPLGGEDPDAGFAFGLPKPRTGLTIYTGGARSVFGIPFHISIHQELERRYRDAFQRLDRAGRIEEAAFVLAELLRESGEAVSYLEKHGKFQLAAQVAESRKLPADVIVRQWLLAGERDRAIAIARAYGAFAVAVAGLEQTHPQTARMLRVRWAEWLAESGQYGTAVDVVWGIEETRAVALVWIERAIAQGGSTGARMLARRLTLAPDDDTLKQTLELLADEEPELASKRAALAKAIHDEPVSPHMRIAARAGVRALVRDSLHSWEAVPRETIAQLANRSGDLALRRDLPHQPVHPPQALWFNGPPLVMEFDATDGGLSPVHDVAVLHEGRVAVAYGESGLAVIGRDGRRVAHYDQPAYRIVLSDAADRAIVIAPRGSVLRLARIDFTARSSAFWCDARLDAWSDDYDGGIWFAAQGQEILGIDATAKRWESLWHNPDFLVPITAVDRNATALHVFGRGPAFVRFAYELPSLILRDRELPPKGIDLAWEYAISSEGVMLGVQPPNMAVIPHSSRATANPLPFDGPIDLLRPLATGHWHVLHAIHEDDSRLFLCDGNLTPRLRATFVLRGARAVQVRIQPGSLAIGDDRGRVIVFDLFRGVVRRNLR